MPKGIKNEQIWKKAKAAVDPEGKGSHYDQPYAVVMDVYKKMGGAFKSKESKKEGSDCKPGQKTIPSSGICTQWKFMLASYGESMGKAPPSVQDAEPAKAEAPAETAEDEARQLVIDNPGMNAATLLNALKAQGLGIHDEKQEVLGKSEADSGSAAVAQLRAGVKESDYTVRENGGFGVKLRCKITEASASDNGVGYTKFRAVLIQEGLGNLRDLYYYTREALESAVPLFEGKKIYADHPSRLEEQDRPERSVRDIIGYFENVALEEAEDGRAMLAADVITLPDDPFRWARALIRESVDYAKKYPDKDFVGLSINASGDAEQQDLESFVKESKIPASVVPKIQKAMDQGAQAIKLVSKLTEAVSCDLVTEAGAGGRVLSLLEGDKQNTPNKEGDKDMKKKQLDAEAKVKESEAHMKHSEDEAKKEDGAQDVAPKDHADEEQDIELIKKMLKDHLGQEESENEDVQKHAKEAYEAYQSMGKDKEESMKCAMEALKLAKHMASKQAEKKEADEEKPAHDDKDADDAHEEPAPKKEASVIIAELKGEIAQLKEALRKFKLADYLDKKLKESKLPVKVTEQFREAIGQPKSEAEIDKLFAAFKKGHEATASVRESEAHEPIDFFVMTEKQTVRTEAKSDKVNFGDFTS